MRRTVGGSSEAFGVANRKRDLMSSVKDPMAHQEVKEKNPEHEKPTAKGMESMQAYPSSGKVDQQRSRPAVYIKKIWPSVVPEKKSDGKEDDSESNKKMLCGTSRRAGR